MAIFAISSLGAGISLNINTLIGFRALQGFGVAILYTVPVSIVASVSPKNLVNKATGILVGVNGFGLAFGPIVGGMIVTAMGWRWIFFVNLPIILMSLLLCLYCLPESRNQEKQPNILPNN